MLKLTGYTIYFVNTRPRWVLLKLTTNEGITGFGELTWHGIQGAIHITRLRELLDQFVIGQSPFFIEKLWSQWYLRPHNRRHSCTVTTPVLSAIEIACWDIIGKACNQPVYNLLGGMVNEKLRSYAYLPTQRGEPEQIAASAVEAAEKGFTAFKLDPVKQDSTLEEIDAVEAIFRTIRGAVGNRCEILLGT